MKIHLLPPESLKPYPKNVKKHDDAQVEGIANAIKQAKGFDQPIVVDKDMVIIKGHGRTLAAIKLGMKSVPVLIRDDLSPAEVEAVRLNDNRAAKGDIDTAMFRELMSDIDMDLLKGVFDDKELEFSVADLGAMTNDAFIVDVDASVQDLQNSTNKHLDELKVRRVPLSKAFGFKDIAGESELAVSRAIAKMQSEFGGQPDEAFSKFCAKYVE